MHDLRLYCIDDFPITVSTDAGDVIELLAVVVLANVDGDDDFRCGMPCGAHDFGSLFLLRENIAVAVVVVIAFAAAAAAVDELPAELLLMSECDGEAPKRPPPPTPPPTIWPGVGGSGSVSSSSGFTEPDTVSARASEYMDEALSNEEPAVADGACGCWLCTMAAVVPVMAVDGELCGETGGQIIFSTVERLRIL